MIDDEKVPELMPLDKLVNGLLDSDAELPDEELTVDYQHGERVFRLIFNSLSFSSNPEGQRIYSYSIYLLEK